jgi:alanyl-tRNA synthetase
MNGKNVLLKNRILLGNKKDNFWEMGDTGPCGPCTEIHVDCRSDEERQKIDGATLVNNDHPQVIEIWNNVFIQYNRKADGSLELLPEKHVDTGMGFERLVRVLQNKKSNYDTDIFMPCIQSIESITNKKYQFSDSKSDIAFRVLADHIRAICFTIADGQIPSNTGAGYVIRRILRRAVRYYYSHLNWNTPLLVLLVENLAIQFKEIFPELYLQKNIVKKIIEEEEKSFLRTLESGIKRFNALQVKNNKIEGSDAFELFDTYGFPLDLTKLMATENGWNVDEEAFIACMKIQKESGKADAKKEVSDWVIFSNENVQFVGYDTYACDSKILRYRNVKTKNEIQQQIVISPTPFYAESGGQVGDTGIITINGETINVINTIKENDLNILLIDEIIEIKKDSKIHATINLEKREKTSANHTSTHLLHAALRNVLGTHVQQKGSLVNSEYLRFDFSHFGKISNDEMMKIEQIVNEKIRENIALEEDRNVPIETAKLRGAMALFGEKYGDTVRVITFDKNYSVELCGGTHVPNTGNIGICKVIAESSIASGIRRIEALTGNKALAYFEEKAQTLNEIQQALKNPKDVIKALENLQIENSAYKKQIEKYQIMHAQTIVEQLINKIKTKDNVNFLCEKVNVESNNELKLITQILKQKKQDLICLLAYENENMLNIALSIDEIIAKSKNLNAGIIIKEYSTLIDGNGGGAALYATAKGNNISAWNQVVKNFYL